MLDTFPFLSIGSFIDHNAGGSPTHPTVISASTQQQMTPPPLVELMGNWLTQSSKRRFFHPFSSCMDVVAIQHLDTATVSNKNEMFCVCVQFYGVI